MALLARRRGFRNLTAALSLSYIGNGAGLVALVLHVQSSEGTGLAVEVDMDYDGPVPSEFTVTLRLPGGFSEDQLERLRVIAGRCPVHRALATETKVTITDRVVPV